MNKKTIVIINNEKIFTEGKDFYCVNFDMKVLSEGLGTYSDVEFIGKDAIKKIQLNGINKKLMGVKIESKKIDVSSSIEIKDLNNNIIGDIRSGIYSPHFNQVIGICMINKFLSKYNSEDNISF